MPECLVDSRVSDDPKSHFKCLHTVIPPSLMALFDCYQNGLVLKNVQLPSMRIMPSPWGLRGLRAAVLNGKVVVTGGTNGNKHANEVYL